MFPGAESYEKILCVLVVHCEPNVLGMVPHSPECRPSSVHFPDPVLQRREQRWVGQGEHLPRATPNVSCAISRHAPPLQVHCGFNRSPECLILEQ